MKRPLPTDGFEERHRWLRTVTILPGSSATDGKRAEQRQRHPVRYERLVEPVPLG